MKQIDESVKFLICCLGTPSLVILLLFFASYVANPAQTIDGKSIITLLSLVFFGVMFIFSLRR